MIISHVLHWQNSQNITLGHNLHLCSYLNFGIQSLNLISIRGYLHDFYFINHAQSNVYMCPILIKSGSGSSKIRL